MSKIICDVCGTAFAENAAQCPICGCAKRKNPMTASGNNNGAENSGYKAVKGGRFSEKNVRKRNQEMARRAENSQDDQEEEKGNKGLILLMFILIGAVIALILYIILRLVPTIFPPQPTDPTEVPTVPPVSQTDPTDPDPSGDPIDDTTVPCEGLILRVPRIELNETGASSVIEVTASPADTTDEIVFTSSNPAVATVDAEGKVTAVSSGEATITVTCGDFHVDCAVVVSIPTEPPTEDPTVPPTEPPTEEPTEPPTEPPTEAPEVLELNREDFMLFAPGETWDLYYGDIPVEDIEWYSDDESVAIIEDGVVTGVGPGTTVVYARYKGQEVSCIVRCNWEPPEPTLDPNDTYYLNYTDVSIGIGESFELILTNSSGETVQAEWQASEEGYVKIEGSTIIGVDYVNDPEFTVYVVIGDVTYSCIVRVVDFS